MTLREIWRRLVATKYTDVLEREVARLRAENRALLNSILGIAGVPPIVVGADASATQAALGSSDVPTESGRTAAPQSIRGGDKSAASANVSEVSASQTAKRAPAGPGMKGVAAPMRRRSWHQIYRILEIDAARKKEVG
jgi:hypothetical protein